MQIKQSGRRRKEIESARDEDAHVTYALLINDERERKKEGLMFTLA